ncbi:hypothetical protein QQP08_010295 [Theobroma cacao]|nr:hypothetical protein QQP08_010295 [Theobroma cacao]
MPAQTKVCEGLLDLATRRGVQVFSQIIFVQASVQVVVGVFELVASPMKGRSFTTKLELQIRNTYEFSACYM